MVRALRRLAGRLLAVDYMPFTPLDIPAAQLASCGCVEKDMVSEHADGAWDGGGSSLSENEFGSRGDARIEAVDGGATWDYLDYNHKPKLTSKLLTSAYIAAYCQTFR